MISASSALKPRITHNVILSEAKNLRSNLYHVTMANRQRCFTSLNMTAPFMKRVPVLLRRNVGVNLLVIPANVFFLSFSKWYVVGDTANSSIRLRIVFSHLNRDTDWSGSDAACPIKFDVP